MIKASVFAGDILTNAGTFETQELAEQWVSFHQFNPESVVYEDITAKLEQDKTNQEALQFLASTDYKVLKYRDQVDMGITPDLAVEEFQYLLEQRQQARDAIK